jgi:hypothetical protein
LRRFRSGNAAAKATNVCQSSISACCNEGADAASGLGFRFFATSNPNSKSCLGAHSVFHVAMRFRIDATHYNNKDFASLEELQSRVKEFQRKRNGGNNMIASVLPSLSPRSASASDSYSDGSRSPRRRTFVQQSQLMPDGECE